ncbi:MAG: PTS sugar transporter subunit IIA [Elusimicrobia bacterium]|nr:PTS sugar transporter subunit IIA [Elusimicrobiota bacterium]
MGLFKKKEPKQASKPLKTASPPNSASSSTQLSKILTPELVLVVPEASNKYELIETMVRRLCQGRPSLSVEYLMDQVMEREQGLSTTLDTGLSLPHSRVDGTNEIFAVLAILPKGLLDTHATEILIRTILLFFSPNDPKFFQSHLQFLQSVSKLFQPALIDQLISFSTPQQVLDLIKIAESAQP